MVETAAVRDISEASVYQGASLPSSASRAGHQPRSIVVQSMLSLNSTSKSRTASRVPSTLMVRSVIPVYLDLRVSHTSQSSVSAPARAAATVRPLLVSGGRMARRSTLLSLQQRRLRRPLHGGNKRLAAYPICIPYLAPIHALYHAYAMPMHHCEPRNHPPYARQSSYVRAGTVFYGYRRTNYHG